MLAEDRLFGSSKQVRWEFCLPLLNSTSIASQSVDHRNFSPPRCLLALLCLIVPIMKLIYAICAAVLLVVQPY